MRGHPFVLVPRVHTDLSTRRVLVSEYVEGEGFEAVRRADEAQRDRYGEIVFRFHFGLLYRDRIALGDPHPGNYLLCPDGRVCFLDFGLVRDVAAARVAAERAIALAVRERDGAAVKAALLAGGYLPAGRADAVDADFALGLMRMATKWYAVPGHRRFSPDGDRRRRDARAPDSEERAAIRMQVNQFTLPPEAVLIRRMHSIVAVVLRSCGQARTGAPSPRSTCTGTRRRRRSGRRRPTSSRAPDLQHAQRRSAQSTHPAGSHTVAASARPGETSGSLGRFKKARGPEGLPVTTRMDVVSCVEAGAWKPPLRSDLLGGGSGAARTPEGPVLGLTPRG